MSSFLPLLLSWLQEYGYPALWLSIFVAAIGVPLPISLVLLGAGAIATLGDFNIILLVLIAVSASTAGDSVGYFLGRRLGSKVLCWLEKKQRFPLLSTRSIGRSRIYFQKRGGWAVFFSRFLFSALGGPINLLAGAELYPYRNFLIYDASGELLGACIPLTLGFIFGTSWEAIGDILGASSVFVVTTTISIYLIVVLIKMARRMQAAKELKSIHVVRYGDASLDMVKERPDTLPL
ncbi:MAG TPA: DedA family protein [Ktedonosporobacter sp.]|nr:DedA family protein [Ktedonosporobacter sp.]